jgi:hypothetical protein
MILVGWASCPPGNTRDGQDAIGVNLSLNAYSTYVLPPLIPPMHWGEKEIQFPPQYIRGGLGWGNADRDGQGVNSISRLDKGFTLS